MAAGRNARSAVLNERKKLILRAVIEDYIATALPIGSVTISKKYFPGLSSATIRNELNDLETLGYLFQPHVSSGRVPNHKAYRMYAESLLQEAEEACEDTVLAEQVFERIRRSDDVMRSAAQTLSAFTHCIAAVALPPQEGLKVERLQLIPLLHNMALLIIVTDNGVVQNSIVPISGALDADSLYAISRTMTERMQGHTLREVQNMLSSLASFQGLDSNVCRSVANLSAQIARQSEAETLIIEGIHNILNFPEYSDSGKAHAFMTALEQKDKLLRLLNSESGRVSVLIGEDLAMEGMEECSLISVAFRAGSAKGSVSVVGPARMPYETVFKIVDATSQALSALMGEENAHE